MDNDKCFNDIYENIDEERIKSIESEFMNLQNSDSVNENIYIKNKIYNKFNITSPYELIIDNTKKSDYEFIYTYYLNKLNIYNKQLRGEIREKVLFWGRINYICKSNYLKELGKQVLNTIDIEEMIKNDIDSKVSLMIFTP